MACASACGSGYTLGSAINKLACVRGGLGMSSVIIGGVLSTSFRIREETVATGTDFQVINALECDEEFGISARFQDSDVVTWHPVPAGPDTVYAPRARIAPAVQDCTGGSARNMLHDTGNGLEVSLSASDTIGVTPVGTGAAFNWIIAPRPARISDKYGTLISGADGLAYTDPPDIFLERFIPTSLLNHVSITRTSEKDIHGDVTVTYALALTDAGREALTPTPLAVLALDAGTLYEAKGDGSNATATATAAAGTPLSGAGSIHPSSATTSGLGGSQRASGQVSGR